MQAILSSAFQPLAGFAREALTPRTIAVLATFFTVLSLAVTWSHITVASSCAAGESVLVYPTYSKKGLIVGSTETCGQPHRGCDLQETGSTSVYRCSPFMAPKVAE